MKKKVQDTQECLLKDNIRMNEEMKKLVEEKVKNQLNNRPKRRIRRYRTLSKQAMKEYAMKKANSSCFDCFEDEEEL